MAGAACYTDPKRTDEFVVVVVSGIVHETIAIPFLARFLVEIRIRKESKTEHTRRLTVNCPIDACGFGLPLFVEPQTKFIRLAGCAESRFVHQAEHFEAFAARIFAVIEHLQQIHQTETVLRDVIPKMLVASAPEVPRVAAHDFLRRKINASIHRLENVCSDLRKICGAFSCRFSFVYRLVFFAAGKYEQGAHANARSDSSETEKMAPRWQHCLHRVVIDTSFVNRVARKFPKKQETAVCSRHRCAQLGQNRVPEPETNFRYIPRAESKLSEK